MKPVRRAQHWIGRALLGIAVACVFATAAVAFRALHHHDHSTVEAGHHCLICLAHATSTSAVTAVPDTSVAPLDQPTACFAGLVDLVVSRAPLTADSRGPPSLL